MRDLKLFSAKKGSDILPWIILPQMGFALLTEEGITLNYV